MNHKSTSKIFILIGLSCLGFIIYGVLDRYDVLSTLQDGKVIKQYIEYTGLFGPFVVILFMTLAILVSPLPSAPIAIASGAIYGHTWGTLYVLIGSLSGASGAFFIARILGYDFIQKLAQGHLPVKLFHSQSALMGIVFVSRLMPFLSFDVISYAAGLSVLEFWRFLLATLFGIVPASFFLAHVGSEMATAEINRIAVAILLLTLITGVSFLIGMLRHKNTNSQP